MSAELVVIRRDDAIVHVVLNRPEKRNALNREVLRALVAAVIDAERDRSVRAIVLSGEGRVFSAGVDFASLKGDVDGEPPAPFRALVGEMQALLSRLETVEKPVIAAMHRYVPGLALELALACDFRIATTDCELGLPEVRVGLVPDVGGMARLVRTVGYARAKELVLTARMISAAEALRIGLVTEVVEPGTHLEAATRLATEIGANAPLAVGLAKRILDLGQHLDTHTFLQVEQLAQSILLPTADAREGASALAERRTPKFTGR
jgi:enoyl-CoA hydratase/carnithine racemase